jgi:hypothetical protein
MSTKFVDTMWGLAQPTHFPQPSANRMPHPWQFHGWDAMPMS